MITTPTGSYSLTVTLNLKKKRAGHYYYAKLENNLIIMIPWPGSKLVIRLRRIQIIKKFSVSHQSSLLGFQTCHVTQNWSGVKWVSYTHRGRAGFVFLPDGEFNFNKNAIGFKCINIVRPDPVVLVGLLDFTNLEHSIFIFVSTMSAHFIPLKSKRKKGQSKQSRRLVQ